MATPVALPPRTILRNSLLTLRIMAFRRRSIRGTTLTNARQLKNSTHALTCAAFTCSHIARLNYAAKPKLQVFASKLRNRVRMVRRRMVTARLLPFHDLAPLSTCR